MNDCSALTNERGQLWSWTQLWFLTVTVRSRARKDFGRKHANAPNVRSCNWDSVIAKTGHPNPALYYIPHHNSTLNLWFEPGCLDRMQLSAYGVSMQDKEIMRASKCLNKPMILMRRLWLAPPIYEPYQQNQLIEVNELTNSPNSATRVKRGSVWLWVMQLPSPTLGFLRFTQNL